MRKLAPIASVVTAAIAFGLSACGDDASEATPGAPADGGPTDDAVPGPGDEAGSDGGVRADRVRFVLLGDFGFDDANEAAVATLVKTWNPDFIVTLGDNSYPESTAATIDRTIGKYYASFIHPYKGQFGPGATHQRFYACLGNHDWQSGSIQAHLDYFELPGNERYWEIAKGPVRFFCVDSDTHEPDGTTPTSVQGKWLEKQLTAAKDPFRIVVFHHPPQSSGQHGDTAHMKWPFPEWGASAVYAGHDHDYERFDYGPGTIPYVVQGIGGADLRPFASSQPGSAIAYSASHGATFVEADERYADFAAITVGLERIDEHVIVSEAEAQRPTDLLLAPASTVQYLESAPATGWYGVDFDASSWKTGAGPLGYGQGGEGTVIAQGLAHYFRASFTVADPNAYDHAVAWLKRDDGAALYVNGVELSRSNLPLGVLAPQTLALQTVGFAAEGVWIPTVIPKSQLRAGTNVVAVELHQATALSSDAIFDLRIEGKK